MMIRLVTTKNFNFTQVQLLRKNKYLADELTQLRRKLMQYGDNFENELRQYCRMIGEHVGQQYLNFEWYPRILINPDGVPTKGQSVRFEVVNWLLYDVQNKLQCLFSSSPDIKVVQELQNALGIIRALKDPDKFTQFYASQAMESIESFILAMMNTYFTKIMDTNDHQHFYNLNSRSKKAYYQWTTFLSLEHFAKINCEAINDKMMLLSTKIHQIIQQIRMFHCQGANYREIEILLDDLEQLDVPAEYASLVMQNYSELFRQIFTKHPSRSEEPVAEQFGDSASEIAFDLTDIIR